MHLGELIRVLCLAHQDRPATVGDVIAFDRARIRRELEASGGLRLVSDLDRPAATTRTAGGRHDGA